MKLTTLDEDLKIHQKLEDEPNDVGGLSAQALKEKFDQAGVTIQKYLNETHLPEEEKAVEDALSEAKAYTDAKTITMDRGNMKTAVYDAKKRHRDIFDYTDEKIEELKGTKTSGAWICSGRCKIYASMGETVTVGQLTELADPDGLWSETAKAFTVPEGGRVALLFLHASSSKGQNSESYVRVFVDGVEQTSRTLGYYNNYTWDFETLVIPLIVEAGNRISIKAEAYNESSAYFSQVKVRSVSVIIFA